MSPAVTDDIQEQPATKDIRFHERLKRLSDFIADDPNIDEDLWAVPLAALAEIKRLRAECDRWREIADDFYEAGSNRVSHSEVADDYEKEVRRD